MIKILILGHNGLVGSALLRNIDKSKYEVFTINKTDLDLRDSKKVLEYFTRYKFNHVYLAAAKVGGIKSNSDSPVEFMLDNLKIQNNVIESSYLTKVDKLLFLGSSCIYPKECPQPIKEDYLLTDKLEPTNEAYALSKISGIRLCEYYNRQYNTNYISVMPCNLYGINDYYNDEKGHVIPSLINKFYKAKINNSEIVELWGDGTPLREFLCSDDLAKACIYLMENFDFKDLKGHINIGSGIEISIKDLAYKIRDLIYPNCTIKFNENMPNGTMRKLLDSTKINNLGWKPSIGLDDGLKLAYEDFLKGHRE